MRTHFISVGLVYLCGLTIGQECNQELMEDVDLLAADIKPLLSPDIEHCQQLCTHHPFCQFFTYASHFKCSLKSTHSGEPEGRNSFPGVTSGFSLKSCNKEPCLSNVYHGVDFYGEDYKSLFTADYEACQRTCTNDPTCQFFTFINENFTSAEYRYKCHLKFSWTAPKIPEVKVKAGLVSGFSHNVQMTQQSDTACQTKLFPNTDIPGKDVESLSAASAEHCHALCSVHPKCTYYSYSSNGFICYLKNNPNEMVMKAKGGVTSGIPAHFCQPDRTWLKKTHADVDFWGADFQDVLADDAEHCQRICTENPNCQFFTHVTNSFVDASYRGLCYLKHAVTLPSPPKVAKLANVVSGFSLRNCGLGSLPPHNSATVDLT